MSYYTIINGEGTIESQAQTEVEAMRRAQEQADEHGESFFVSGPGIETDDEDDTDLGVEVEPSQMTIEMTLGADWGCDHTDEDGNAYARVLEHAIAQAFPRAEVSVSYSSRDPNDRIDADSGIADEIRDAVLPRAWELFCARNFDANATIAALKVTAKTLALETTKGTHTGTLREICEWQSEYQGGFETLVLADDERIDVSDVEWDAENIEATEAAVIDAITRASR